MKKLTDLLKELAQKSESDLYKDVIDDLLNQGDDEDIESYIENASHGCETGAVTSLIYYTDTKKFFIKHYEEILNLLDDFNQEYGQIKFTINFNSLAWLAYDTTLTKVCDDIVINQLANLIEMES